MIILYESDIFKKKWKFGGNIPKPNGRRCSLTYLMSNVDGKRFATRCNYCGGFWKLYQSPHHNMNNCKMKI